jgi:hypothetical protein
MCTCQRLSSLRVWWQGGQCGVIVKHALFVVATFCKLELHILELTPLEVLPRQQFPFVQLLFNLRNLPHLYSDSSGWDEGREQPLD